MKTAIVVTYLILTSACIVNLDAAGAQEHLRQMGDFIRITSTKSYSVTNGVLAENTGLDLTKIVIYLPVPQTNNYQVMTNLDSTDAEILDIPETDDKYARYTITGTALPPPGESRTYGYGFDVTLYGIVAEVDQITTVYPYDTTSNVYRWYTGASGVFVDPYNSSIQSWGDSIWGQSSDLIDYAERCYQYVAETFEYLNPNTGLHPLSTILANGGGDCGNLSSIYISLLRHKGIPARHIVTVRPDGSYHVWADFYMENYGWIPVDVTYDLGNPDGDYFGEYDGNGIVFTKEVWLLLDAGDHPFHYPLLQTFIYSYSLEGGEGSLRMSHNLHSVPSSVDYEFDGTSAHFVLRQNYPNPFNQTTDMQFTLPKSGFVTLTIYDLLGRKVRSLVSEHLSSGYKSVLWDGKNEEGKDVASGIYLYRLRAGNFVDTKKMLLLK